MTHLAKTINSNFIPIAEPWIGKEEEVLVLDALRSGWISSIGRYVGEFEDEFARFASAKHAITVSNGTAALHLALVALEIGPGDEIIIPDLTYIATANAVAYTGATPVLVDVDKDTWTIDPNKREDKINRRTKAIIPVHLYGHPADMDPIMAISRKHNLFVIEDAAEAHGAIYKNQVVGSIGTIGCFSFFGNKIITTGEGGMLTLNNNTLAEKIRILKNQGVSKTKKYFHPEIGFNYRMTNIQAAIGLAQLRKVQKVIDRKIAIAKLYQKFLSPLVPQVTLHPQAEWARCVFWLYSILIHNKGIKNRDHLMEALKESNIDSRPFFYPIHHQPKYKSKDRLPVSENLSTSGINLPSSPNLTDEKIEYICKKIITFLD